MNVFVLGARVSKKLGYPLGGELLGAVDSFVRSSPKEFDRFNTSEWPSLSQRLAENENILVRQAYKVGHFEYLLTALDLHEMVTREFSFQTLPPGNRDLFEKEYTIHSEHIRWNIKDREMLLSALAEFLQHKHDEDQLSFDTEAWSDLKVFGKKLQKGDVVVTFNYDSCVETVMLQKENGPQKVAMGFKWNSSDEVITSDISILHLHGATGWYHPTRISSGSTFPLIRSFSAILAFRASQHLLPEAFQFSRNHHPPELYENVWAELNRFLAISRRGA